MKTYKKLYGSLTSLENLQLALKKARKGKTLKDYVIEFEKNSEEALLQLRTELLLHCYEPRPLINFVIHDPKTRKISKSDFRDRVVHHALCNIIEPIFEKRFIFDSFANQVGKGTLKAVRRFDYFKRKASKNNQIDYHIFKADIKKYFENVDHKILLSIIKKKIADKRVIWLIKKILANSSSQSKGMPLGNLTSQFFANIYLNELDHFIKNQLRARYYLRYVDDFVILHHSKKILETYQSKINQFLKEKLNLELHPEKSKIFKSKQGLGFLGFKIFYHHKLLKKKNLKMFKKKLVFFCSSYGKKLVGYDAIYNFLEGWVAYAKNADTYKLRMLITSQFEKIFPNEISFKEINRSAQIIKNH